MAMIAKNEPISLEIKTKSIEKTLIPLVTQITTLVNAKEKPLKSEKTLRAIVHVGQAVNFAVQKFVSVGEAIADDNCEIKSDMYEACKDARTSGAIIEKLCDVQPSESGQLRSYADKNNMVRAAKTLLSSVTRVLLLADIVVVKQLISSKDRVSISLNRLENAINFTEFVKAFSQFGNEMVELAHLTGDRQNDLKDERRRSQMAVARQILERSTMMLLTSSKVFVVLCVLFVATQANPAFRALRARASGLGGGAAPGAPAPQAAPVQPAVAPQQPLFQPVYQAQPQQYQAQPQYQQYQPRASSFGNYPGVPFGGYQPVQG